MEKSRSKLEKVRKGGKKEIVVDELTDVQVTIATVPDKSVNKCPKSWLPEWRLTSKYFSPNAWASNGQLNNIPIVSH